MTRTEISIQRMRQGYTTALGSALNGGVIALSQLVGRLEAVGYVFSKKWLDLIGGGRVMSYKLIKSPKRRKECK